jgi:hypothetical protein
MSLNMIRDMNEALEDAEENTRFQNSQYVVDALKYYYDSYVKEAYRYSNNIPNFDKYLFSLMEILLVYLAQADGHTYGIQYDCYCRFCNAVGFNCLSENDYARFKREKNYSLKEITDWFTLDLTGDIVSEKAYSVFLRALCHFVVLIDPEITEKEFNIIYPLYYNCNYECCRGNWQTFKRYLNNY